jgi:trk system potassium uptake protein TrkH
MVNFRIVARVISKVLIFEGLFMLLSAAISLICKEEKTASTFLYSALITIVTGVLVFTPLRNEEKNYGTKEGYIISTGIYLILCLFGTLPFILGGFTDSFTDALFESVSGFTTTNATIFRDVESLPRGILFWRSLTQWLGGIATIALSLYVLPIIKSLNIQLPTNEFSGPTSEKIHPRIVEAAKRFILIYAGLTLIEALLLIIGKMPLFDAVCHSLSTLSAGGFSTRNDGIAAFSSPYLRAVITIFMFFAGTTISLFYFAAKGNFKKIYRNNEFVFYFIITFITSLLVSAVLYIRSGLPLPEAISEGFFNVISILTTTGFFTADYNLWGSFLVMIIVLLMFIGGMAGSTSGGLKIIRLLIISKNSRTELKRLVHPNAWLPVRIDQKTVPQNIVTNLLVFTAIYCLSIFAGSIFLSLMDFDILTSFSTTLSMLGNIGPGIGAFGPFTGFSEVPEAGKWVLSGLMVTGRLEFLTVIILFTRSFYKK